ncbi:hypothetical protein [Aureispira anguillae]|uniref:Lipoprotein n=1 Tax=Aureispira anguillae TaxID=2864201 RepID=A0A915YLZ2_9BACT|nr:hypothetical protein [Aureispira anguillae]BDS15563.1 hypothetical protein AsAng_0063470 [Aureispira anguillae]
MKIRTVILFLLCSVIFLACRQFTAPNPPHKSKNNSPEPIAVTYKEASNSSMLNRAIDRAKRLSQETFKFRIEETKGGILLHWSLKKNKQTQGFIVERSKDGLSFEPIAKVQDQLKGRLKHYSYTDIFPMEGRSYYRIKQWYKDGGDACSLVKKIVSHSSNKAWMKVVPYVDEQLIRLCFDLDKVALPIRVELLDELGTSIYYKISNKPVLEIAIEDWNSTFNRIKATSFNQETLIEELKVQ